MHAVIPHYEDGGGSQPALVVSNSLGTNLHMWDATLPHLAKDFRVIRYDQRGHGGTPAPAGGYGIPELGADVIDLLDDAGVPQAFFCGVSMGGLTGQWLAAHHRDRITRVVVSNTAPSIGTDESWNGRIATVREHGMAAIADGVVGAWLTPEFAAQHTDVVDQLKEMLLATDPDGYAQACAAVRDADCSGDLGRVRVPLLAIAGTQDAPTPPNATHRIVELQRSARYIELDAAHVSPAEVPEAYAACVREFLLGTPDNSAREEGDQRD